MAENEAATLRRELAKHEKGRGKRYPKDLKRRVTTYALAQRDGGVSFQAVADALQMKYETVRRWCLHATTESPDSPKLVPVELADPLRSTVVIVSPSGFRLEGLEPAEAIAALRTLR